MKNNPSNYYMLAGPRASLATVEGSTTLTMPADLAQRVRPGDAILLGTWDEDALTGKVSGLCTIKVLDPVRGTASVVYVDTDLALKPNPSGRRWWRNAHFKFAESVRERYMLDDLFAEHFPGYADIEVTPLRQPGTNTGGHYQSTAGYIYVLQSQYGYKIGKTVSLKSRTRIFEVKLPFKFDLILSGYVENYSKAEADLHRQFSDLRLEGEWFDLKAPDIQLIKTFLDSHRHSDEEPKP